MNSENVNDKDWAEKNNKLILNNIQKIKKELNDLITTLDAIDKKDIKDITAGDLKKSIVIRIYSPVIRIIKEVESTSPIDISKYLNVEENFEMLKYLINSITSTIAKTDNMKKLSNKILFLLNDKSKSLNDIYNAVGEIKNIHIREEKKYLDNAEKNINDFTKEAILKLKETIKFFDQEYIPILFLNTTINKLIKIDEKNKNTLEDKFKELEEFKKEEFLNVKFKSFNKVNTETQSEFTQEPFINNIIKELPNVSEFRDFFNTLKLRTNTIDNQVLNKTVELLNSNIQKYENEERKTVEFIRKYTERKELEQEAFILPLLISKLNYKKLEYAILNKEEMDYNEIIKLYKLYEKKELDKNIIEGFVIKRAQELNVNKNKCLTDIYLNLKYKEFSYSILFKDKKSLDITFKKLFELNNSVYFLENVQFISENKKKVESIIDFFKDYFNFFSDIAAKNRINPDDFFNKASIENLIFFLSTKVF